MIDGKQTDKFQYCERARANESPSFPFSHHPNCGRFKSHTFTLGLFRFCIGCYIGYPMAIIGLVLGTSLYLQGLVSLWHLLSFGIGGYITLLISLGKFSEIRKVKILQKTCMGMGSGFLLVTGFFLFDIFLLTRIIIASFIFLGLIMPIRAVHMQKATKICLSCVLKGTDPHCAE